MREPATAAEVARAIADALDRHRLPYAIGGAIALGFYAVPRATVDVDVNIFGPPADQLVRALAAVADAGFDAEEEESQPIERDVDAG